MGEITRKKAVYFFVSAVFLWIGVKFLLPLALPFLLGAILALAAEPAVSVLHRRWKLPRCVGTPVAVSGIFILSLALLLLLLALLGRQVQRLSAVLPSMEAAAQQGLSALRSWLVNTAAQLPGSMGTVATKLAGQLLSDGTSLLGQAAMKLPQLAGNLLSSLSGGLVWVITGIISSFMISARLPELRQRIHSRLPDRWWETVLPAAKNLRKALSGWLLAEAKLAGIAFGFLMAGFFLLRVENAFLWAVLVTLVDAFPILGVGAVLVPWSMVCLLQGNTARGVGLLALYGVIWLTRSILEPKLIGKGLGLDPLVTLIAIYAGWKIAGIIGMLLSPILALTVIQVSKQLQQ